jgi:hypothetical protein
MSNSPRACFFIGPSLTVAEVMALCQGLEEQIVVLPPVQQGDLLRLLGELPEVIGIIDGYFFQVPAVLHKEILLVLERGVRVVGAASLGALRAAELDRFGMEGIGEIYHRYQQGVLDGDDEVAVLHSSAAEGFQPLTEPLVNIRQTVQQARLEGIISARTAAAVVRCAKRLDFTQRRYETVLAAVRLSAEAEAERTALARFVREKPVDLKRADAQALVRTVAARLRGEAPWPAKVLHRTAQTIFLHLFEREYRGATIAGQHLPEARVLSLYKLLAPGFPGLHRRMVRRWLAVDEARAQALVAAPAETLIASFRAKRGLPMAEPWFQWLAAVGLTEADVSAWLEERALVSQLWGRLTGPGPAARAQDLLQRVAARLGVAPQYLQVPLMQPGVPWEGSLIRELKLRGQWGHALTKAQAVYQFWGETEQRLPGLSTALAPARLEAWFAQRWNIPAHDFLAMLPLRGFRSYHEFVETARLAYVYDHQHRAGQH